jgi:hypothetical protein
VPSIRIAEGTPEVLRWHLPWHIIQSHKDRGKEKSEVGRQTSEPPPYSSPASRGRKEVGVERSKAVERNEVIEQREAL